MGGGHIQSSPPDGTGPYCDSSAEVLDSVGCVLDLLVRRSALASSCSSRPWRLARLHFILPLFFLLFSSLPDAIVVLQSDHRNSRRGHLY